MPIAGGDATILSRPISDIVVNTAHLAKSLTDADRSGPRPMGGRRIPAGESGIWGLGCAPAAAPASLHGPLLILGMVLFEFSGSLSTQVNKPSDFFGLQPAPLLCGTNINGIKRHRILRPSINWRHRLSMGNQTW